ncbi:hypothetical protein D3C72_1201660 [compost metagenome]
MAELHLRDRNGGADLVRDGRGEQLLGLDQVGDPCQHAVDGTDQTGNFLRHAGERQPGSAIARIQPICRGRRHGHRLQCVANRPDRRTDDEAEHQGHRHDHRIEHLVQQRAVHKAVRILQDRQFDQDRRPGTLEGLSTGDAERLARLNFALPEVRRVDARWKKMLGAFRRAV